MRVRSVVRSGHDRHPAGGGSLPPATLGAVPDPSHDHPSPVERSGSLAAPGTAPAGAAGPLTGVRVLDLSSVVMGPLATQTLGDLGADVICVEAATGDTNRIMGPSPAPGLSVTSLNLSRNKRNVCLDLKRPDARDAVRRLAATCDVFVTNLRPSPLARLGLSYDDVRAVRPDIVMCRAHGWPSGEVPEAGPWGETGADPGPGVSSVRRNPADRPAYDDVVQAEAGLAHTFQLRDGRPALAPTLVADKVAGMAISQAVLAALFHRERTGEGQFVEVSMVEALRAFVLVEHGGGAITVPPIGPAGYPRITIPERRPYATTDGWVAVLAYSTEDYRALFTEGGRTDLLDDPRIASARARMAHAAELYAIVEQVVATRSTSFWVAFCEEHDIPAAAVRTVDELVAELPVVQHPVAGPHHLVPPAWRFSRTPASVRRPAPLLGEHTREVLAEVGYDDASIERMIASGAIPR